MPKAPEARPQRKVASVVFADVKGYSRLTEPQLMRFMQQTMSEIAKVLDNSAPFYRNSWGDAIVAAFDDPRDAANCALALRDLFTSIDWGRVEMPPLRLRTAVHAGTVYVGEDPITGQEGITGTQITLAARIEPVTLAGHVWVTDSFVRLLSQEEDLNVKWDDLGERPLAKEWGAARLYRLRRATEPDELPSLRDEQDTAGPSVSPMELTLTMLEMGTDEQVRVALDVLGQFEHPRAIAALVAAAKNQSLSDADRRMAILSLGDIRSPRCVPDVIDLAMNPSEPPAIRRPAVQVLGDIKDSRCIPSLAELVVNPAEHSASTDLVTRALFALSEFQDEHALSAIQQAVESHDSTIVPAALIATAKTQNPRFVNSLVRIAADRDQWPEEVRGTALEAIVLLGPNVAAGDQLETIARDRSEAPGLREYAALALGLIGTEGTRATLLQIAERLDDPLSAYALRVVMKSAELKNNLKRRFLEDI